MKRTSLYCKIVTLLVAFVFATLPPYIVRAETNEIQVTESFKMLSVKPVGNTVTTSQWYGGFNGTNFTLIVRTNTVDGKWQNCCTITGSLSGSQVHTIVQSTDGSVLKEMDATAVIGGFDEFSRPQIWVTNNLTDVIKLPPGYPQRYLDFAIQSYELPTTPTPQASLVVGCIVFVIIIIVGFIIVVSIVRMCNKLLPSPPKTNSPPPVPTNSPPYQLPPV